MIIAKVNTNLLDLWMEPRYNSERASQLLFNEPLRVIDEQNGYTRIEQTDRYSGWADQRFLFKTSDSELDDFNSDCNFIVCSPQARLYSAGKNSISPHILFYGSKIKGVKTKSGLINFQLPTGDFALLKPQNLKPINRKEKATAPKVLKEARKWLGVPYLWGGTTLNGADCSGFVRQVFAQFNVYLPRDTKDQIMAGKEIPRNSIKAGDLVFFNRHVGIAMNKNTLIHCSLGSNGVRIQTIESGGEDYRPDLDENYATTRRII